jgi:hypothetical protein
VAVSKILYTPLSVGLGLGAGFIARKAFSTMWDRLDDQPDGPPKPGDEAASLGKVVAASALQATTFAVTKVVVDRQGRRLYQHLTGFWPGKTIEQTAQDRAEAASSS